MRFALRESIISIAVLSFCAGGNAQVSAPQNQSIEFEGNKVFSTTDLMSVMRKCLASDLSWDKTHSQQTLDYCLGRFKFFFHSKGYLQANINKSQRDPTGKQSSIVILIDEGVVFRLGSIDVKGSRILSSVQIIEMLKLKSGDIADAEQFDKWLFEGLKPVYDRLGYIQYGAELLPTFEVKPGSKEGVVNVRVTIDEGNQFTLGSVDFVGSHDISPEMLLKQMLVRKGDVFNRELFEDSLKGISDMGLFEQIDSLKDVEYMTHPKESFVDVAIHLKKSTSRGSIAPR